MQKKAKKVTLARYLYREYKWGACYLVRNKDGLCYLVDHGVLGPIKTENSWEDEELGFDEQNVFQETKYDFDFVSWEDEEPLHIWSYLKENGWVDEKGEFVSEKNR